jgi:ribosomal protein S18 acetylase RimI-like enzyme
MNPGEYAAQVVGVNRSMSDNIRIRKARPADCAVLREAIVELQEFERRLSDTRRPGEDIADAYLARMESRAGRGGAILIAEVDGAFAGFVTSQLQEVDYIAETPDSNRFGYISDVCVLPAWRGRGIARLLLEAAERHLAPLGITRLRVHALADNASARRSYEQAGFVAYEVLYEKSVHAPAISPRHRDPSPDPARKR